MDQGSSVEPVQAGDRKPSGIRVVAEGATPQELAAILAAVEALWPRSSDTVRTPPEPGAWRFSGRWWQAGSLPIRRV